MAATLVESARIDGQPRQRHLAYLGSIMASELGGAAHRAVFWDAVANCLDRLDNRITAEERARIRVPRPSVRQREAAQRRAGKAVARLASVGPTRGDVDAAAFWEHRYAVPVDDAKLLGIAPPGAGEIGSACRMVRYEVLLDRRHPEHRALIKRHRAFKRAQGKDERALRALADTEDYHAARERHQAAREQAAAGVKG